MVDLVRPVDAHADVRRLHGRQLGEHDSEGVEVQPRDEIRPPNGWEIRPETQRHWLRGAELFEERFYRPG